MPDLRQGIADGDIFFNSSTYSRVHKSLHAAPAIGSGDRGAGLGMSANCWRPCDCRDIVKRMNSELHWRVSAIFSVPSNHRAIRVLVSAAGGLLSGYWVWRGILGFLAAPFERQYGPNVFAEDGPVGITMFVYMVETLPIAVIVTVIVSIVIFRIYGRRRTGAHI